jgi:long-subunit fatty acid transport protein
MAVDLDKYIVGSGVAYSLDAYTLEFTYALVLMTDREITNSNLQQTSAARPPWNGRSIIGNGKYEGNAHILGLGVHYNL